MLNPHAEYTLAERQILNNPLTDVRQVARVKDAFEQRRTGINPHNEEKLNKALQKRFREYWHGAPPQEAQE